MSDLAIIQEAIEGSQKKVHRRKKLKLLAQFQSNYKQI